METEIEEDRRKIEVTKGINLVVRMTNLHQGRCWQPSSHTSSKLRFLSRVRAVPMWCYTMRVTKIDPKYVKS